MYVMGQKDPTVEFKWRSPIHNQGEGYSWVLELRNGNENRAMAPVRKDEEGRLKISQVKFLPLSIKMDNIPTSCGYQESQFPHIRMISNFLRNLNNSL